MITIKTVSRRLLSLLFVTLGAISQVGAQEPVRIMPLGDSITAGFIPPSTFAGGYRERLYSLLTAPTEGFAVDYVGTLNYPGAVAEGWVDGDHEGHGGFKIADIRTGIPVWLKQVPDPDVILLKIGTNDFWSGENLAVTQDRLRGLIADISTLRPHARIIVANLIPRYDSIDAIQAQFSASLPALVATQAALGRKVTFVDMRASFGSNPADIGADGVHPTASGHDKIADGWLPAVKNVITPLGTNEPPVIISASARADLQHVTVTFSKPINDADGANAANFALSGGVNVSQAVLSSSKRVVTLTTGSQLASKSYTLTVSGVRDRLVVPNTILPASTALFTSRSFLDGSFEQNDPAWLKQGTVSVQDAISLKTTDGQKLVVFSGADGANNGVISQSVPTIPNQKYRLQFDMGIYASSSKTQSVQLTVRDDVGGAVGQVLLSPPAASLSLVNTTGIPATNWRILSYEFTAISASTTVSFADASTETASVDLLLDDVRLEAVTNSAPVAANDGGIGTPFLAVAAGSGASAPIAVLANDSDPDNDALTVTAAASPNGTVSIAGGQTLSFTPAVGFSGEATISYTVSDGNGGVSSATVWVSVLVVGPFGNGSFENGPPVNFGIPANWDVSGSAISYANTGFYVPPSGNGNWMVVFNAGNNVPVSRLWQTFSTVVGQTYTVTFDAGLAAGEGAKMQVLSASVDGEFNPPGSPRSWQISSNDPLASWDEKSFTFVAGSSAAKLTFTVDISAGGEAAENVDLVLDDVRVTAAGGINQAPVAAADSYSTPAGLTLNVAAPGVLGNDNDDNPLTLTAVVDSPPNQGGSLTLNQNGSFTYTPLTGFTGLETFSYHATDGLLSSAVTTVTINVTPVGAFVNGSFENGSPTSFGAPQAWSATGVVTYFDATNYLPAANNGTWMAVFNPGNNTPTVSTLSQTFATVAGQAYKVQFDAALAGGAGSKLQTLQAEVSGESNPPATRTWAITSNGPVANWTENLDRTFNFTATGTAVTLTFRVDISAGAAANNVDLLLDDVRITEVTIVNQAPVATADAYSVQAGSTLTVAAPGVLGNDTDDNGPLTAVIDSPLNQGGNLTLNANGSFTYTPASGFSGTETFSYHATDGLLSSAVTTVTITVTPVGAFVNGSFETGSPTLFGPPQGWSATGAVTYFDANYVPAANNGTWMAVFNPGANTPDVSTLSQTFATVAGQAYKVQFDAGMAGQSGKIQTLQAAVGATNLFSQAFTSTGPAAVWTENLTFNFTASGPVTTLTFSVDITGLTSALNTDLLLDDVRITEVSIVNQAPVAVADAYSVQAGSTLTVAASTGVLDNDTDDNGPLTAIVDSPPNQGGSLTLNPDGSFSYTPATGFSGTETFSYHATDGLLSSAVTTVTITVTPVGAFVNGSFENGPPTSFGAPQSWLATGVVTYFDASYVPAANNGAWMAVFNPGANTPDVSTLSQTFATVAGQAYKVQFDAGMAGQSGKSQTLQAAVGGSSLFSQAFTSSGPTATWTEDLTFNFTASGPVTTLTFSVDITGLTSALNTDLLLDDVRITEVSIVNQAPVAVADAYSVQAGSTLTVAASAGVLDNDEDDNGPLTAVIDSPLNQGGSLTLNPDGSFSYTPASGFSGTETFSYHATDGLLSSAVTTVTITVTPVGAFVNGSFENGPPTLFGAPQGWAATGVVTFFDTNYVPAANNGTWMAVFNPGGNTPDVATLSQTFATVSGQTYKVQFDAGMAGQSGKSQTLQAAVGGSSLFSQAFTSTGPTAVWTENLTFNFTASGPVTTLTFSVDITGLTPALNTDLLLDDVRITEVSIVNQAPVAVADAYSVQAGSTLTVAAPGVLGNDTDDNGPLTAVIDSPLNQGGNLTFNANGSFTYTPATGFSGTETFSYHATDGLLSSAVTTVTITVTPVGAFVNGSFENGPPTSFGAPQSWLATGVVTYFDATNYLPAANNGTWMAVFNPGGNTPSVSTLSQTFATVPGQAYSVTFDAALAGGTGSKLQTLQAQVSGESNPPATRTWAITSTGPVADWTENLDQSFNFTAGGPVTTLTFTVDISAGGAASNVDFLLDDVRVELAIIPNLAPVAVDDGTAGAPLVTIAEDSGATAPISVLANDSDPNLDPLTITQASSLNGTVVINGGQTLTFSPNAHYNGTASISYTISDGQGATASAVVFVSVTPVNDPPVAVNDGSAGNPFLTVAEDSGVSAPVNVLANDMDMELNPLTVSQASSPNGQVVINGNQSLSFTPALNFNGPTTISYTISDGKGGTADATAFVSVTPVNDAPVANAQSVAVNEDGSVAITLTGSDVDGNPLTFAIGTASHGSLNLSGAVATYSPEANYSGADSFTFTVSDGIVTSAPATVSITVNGSAGSDFSEWLSTHLLAAGVGADSDGDSLSNAVEYVTGGNPKSQMDAGLLPTISRVTTAVGGNPPTDYLLFTYRRTDRSKNDLSTAIKVEWSNGLSGTWADAAASPGVVVVGENDGFAPGVDRMKVYLPLSLAAGGRFFTRLGVDISDAEPDE